MADFVVAIDGGAGTGKSTTAKGVARRLGFFYLDTGAMYRAVTLKYLQLSAQVQPIDLAVIKKIITETEITLQEKDHTPYVYLDGNDVTLQIRAGPVNRAVSPVSAVPQVREWMVAQQRAVAKGKHVVCEGRDIGTVVFPDAQVKVFLVADLQVRAERRLLELKTKGIEADYKEVLENLKFRDQYDSTRCHSPLKKAKDAIVLDTTNLTIEQEIAEVENLVRQRIFKGSNQ